MKDKTDIKELNPMKTEAKHTPTPWELNGNDETSCTITYKGKGHGDLDTLIAQFGSGGLANAELIIRAVNSHEELLAAARVAYASLRRPNAERDENKTTNILLYAIAKAEGK